MFCNAMGLLTLPLDQQVVLWFPRMTIQLLVQTGQQCSYFYDHNAHGGESMAKLFAESMVFLVGDNIKGTVFGKALIFSLVGIELDLGIGVGCCQSFVQGGQAGLYAVSHRDMAGSVTKGGLLPAGDKHLIVNVLLPCCWEAGWGLKACILQAYAV